MSEEEEDEDQAPTRTSTRAVRPPNRYISSDNDDDDDEQSEDFSRPSRQRRRRVVSEGDPSSNPLERNDSDEQSKNYDTIFNSGAVRTETPKKKRSRPRPSGQPLPWMSSAIPDASSVYIPQIGGLR